MISQTGPPGTRKAVGNSAGQVLNGSRIDNSPLVCSQARCGHFFERRELMPPGYQHHAKVTCRECGAFLRWISKPETLERQRRNAARLARLAMCDGLTRWERNFVNDLLNRDQRRLSPRQHAIFDRFCSDYLEGGPQ